MELEKYEQDRLQQEAEGKKTPITISEEERPTEAEPTDTEQPRQGIPEEELPVQEATPVTERSLERRKNKKNPDRVERKHRHHRIKQSRSNNFLRNSQSNRRSETRQARNGKLRKRHHLIPSSGVCSTFWKNTEAGCGFEVQGTFPRACHVLAGQKSKDKWEGGVGNRNIIIIRRDGSGTVLPIRIRTDSDAGFLSAPIVTLPDAYKRIRCFVNAFRK